MTVRPVEDELLGAGHHALQHRDVSGMRWRLGPVGLGMPIREDKQRRRAWIPGLAVAIGQGVRQGIAHLQLGQFAQKVLQRQVFVGEAMQNLQPLTLIVIQVARATQTEQGQVEQVIQLVPDRLRFTVDHARGGFRLRDGVWSLGACQARLDGLDHAAARRRTA